jgi:hypothetical protein
MLLLFLDKEPNLFRGGAHESNGRPNHWTVRGFQQGETKARFTLHIAEVGNGSESFANGGKARVDIQRDCDELN